MRHLLTSTLLLLTLVTTSFAQNWPQFRGPNGAGQSDATTIPTKWTKAEENWRVALPGVGHSSPIVWGDRVLLTSGNASSGGLTVLCHSTTDGRELWSAELPSSVHRLHRQNSYASSTPTTDGERVFVATCNPEAFRLTAFNLQSGAKEWDYDLGPYASSHGFGTSPIVYDGNVIIGNEQLKGSYLLALNAADGEIVWKTPRDSADTAYSVPCLYEPAGQKPQLIFNSTAYGVSGVDAATGKPLWSKRVFTLRSVSSPIIAGGNIFGSCGSGGGGNYVVAMKPPTSGAGEPTETYSIRSSAPYVPSPIAHGDLVFLWSDKGVVTCINATDGKVHWRERVGGSYSGSPIRVGGHLYCTSMDGEVVVLRASKQFKVVARNDLGNPSRATPAVADGRMYLRTYSELISIGG